MKEEIKRNAKKKNLILENKKIILLFLIICAILYVLYTIYLLIRQPTNIFTVEEGKIYYEETDIGYVIRDEKVAKGENFKNGMEQIRSEGERAAKGENIFRYYSTNEGDLKKKIDELDGKIQEVMKKDTGIFSSDMKLYENQIDEKVQEINKITDATKLVELKKEIDGLVSKKAKIAGDSSPQGSYLKQLIEERKEYESKLNAGAEYVTAPISGIVSYKVDGLEETLSPNNFDALTKEYLQKLDLKTGKIVATNEEAGKVINNFECYIATITSSEQANKAESGKRIKVRLANNEEISAEIIDVKKQENDDEVVLIIKLDKQIEELINYRKISFELIWWDDSGLKVPNQAIVNIDGLNYVVRNRAGYYSKLLVNVTRRGENYSIVEPYDADELKQMGYTSKEIIEYKKISIYDEIVLNPDLSKIE